MFLDILSPNLSQRMDFYFMALYVFLLCILYPCCKWRYTGFIRWVPFPAPSFILQLLSSHQTFDMVFGFFKIFSEKEKYAFFYIDLFYSRKGRIKTNTVMIYFYFPPFRNWFCDYPILRESFLSLISYLFCYPYFHKC